MAVPPVMPSGPMPSETPGVEFTVPSSTIARLRFGELMGNWASKPVIAANRSAPSDVRLSCTVHPLPAD